MERLGWGKIRKMSYKVRVSDAGGLYFIDLLLTFFIQAYKSNNTVWSPFAHPLMSFVDDSIPTYFE